jgi:hypothetical protein
MTFETTVKNAKTSLAQRRDKRFFILASSDSIWKKNGSSSRAFGPFHKREQAAAWAKENLSENCKHTIMHMEAP